MQAHHEAAIGVIHFDETVALTSYVVEQGIRIQERIGYVQLAADIRYVEG